MFWIKVGKHYLNLAKATDATRDVQAMHRDPGARRETTLTLVFDSLDAGEADRTATARRVELSGVEAVYVADILDELTRHDDRAKALRVADHHDVP